MYNYDQSNSSGRTGWANGIIEVLSTSRDSAFRISVIEIQRLSTRPYKILLSPQNLSIKQEHQKPAPFKDMANIKGFACSLQQQ